MAAEDITANTRVYDEGRVAGDGYSGYHRAFPGRVGRRLISSGCGPDAALRNPDERSSE